MDEEDKNVLFPKIHDIHPGAVQVLNDAGFSKDSEILSLTRVDLNELFPGSQKIKMRIEIFELIQKQQTEESVRAAISNGVSVEYLHLLKNFRTQVNSFLTSLDAHIKRLENENKQKTERQLNRGSSATTGPTESYNSGSGFFQGVVGSLFSVPRSRIYSLKQEKGTVPCKVVVRGVTFNADSQLLEKVRSMAQDCDFVFSSSLQDYQSLIVFCPVISRAGTDVDAAMRDVEGNKPIILVLMHHLHEARNTSSIRSWGDFQNVVLHVDIFYHETACGLLDCQQNIQAASTILKKLQEYKIMPGKDSTYYS